MSSVKNLNRLLLLSLAIISGPSVPFRCSYGFLVGLRAADICCVMFRYRRRESGLVLFGLLAHSSDLTASEPTVGLHGAGLVCVCVYIRVRVCVRARVRKRVFRYAVIIV